MPGSPRGEPQIDSHGVVHATNAWGDAVAWCAYQLLVEGTVVVKEHCRYAPGRPFTCLWCVSHFWRSL